MRHPLMLLLLAVLAAPSSAQQAVIFNKPKDLKSDDPNADLLLGLTSVTLGIVDSEAEKKRYMTTIGLEKMRIQRAMLDVIYQNAYEMYTAGDYEGARELARRVLSVDPSHPDAQMLTQASAQVMATPGGGSKLAQRKLLDNKFRQGMSYYQTGRLVEATREWEEVVKLYPGNLKARYWLKKANKELAEEHYRRGREAYGEHQLREAMDQFYSAMLLNPKIPRLSQEIARVEGELREEEANKNLQAALNLYGEGKIEEAYSTLGRVLEIQPGDQKTQKLYDEMRTELAKVHVRNGRRLYQSRKYLSAIESWKTAKEFGYDPKQANELIERAKAQMDREKNAKARAEEEAELAKQRAEEAARRKAEEDAEKEAEEAEKPTISIEAKPSNVVTEQARKQAETHYLTGLRFFQNGNLEKARDEWMLAKQLDPGHQDADAGLKRIEQMVGARP